MNGCTTSSEVPAESSLVCFGLRPDLLVQHRGLAIFMPSLPNFTGCLGIVFLIRGTRMNPLAPILVSILIAVGALLHAHAHAAGIAVLPGQGRRRPADAQAPDRAAARRTHQPDQRPRRLPRAQRRAGAGLLSVAQGLRAARRSCTRTSATSTSARSRRTGSTSTTGSASPTCASSSTARWRCRPRSAWITG